MSKALDWVRRATEVLSFFSIAVGMVYGAYQFQQARESAQESRVQDAYDSLSKEYIRYEELCLKYTELDCADGPEHTTRKLSRKDKIQQRLILNVWLSMAERAYLEKLNGGFTGHHDEWVGWDEYFASYAQRAWVRKLWKSWVGNGYDSGYDYRFSVYFTHCVDAFGRASKGGPVPTRCSEAQGP